MFFNDITMPEML